MQPDLQLSIPTETISPLFHYLFLKLCHHIYLLDFELSNLKPVCNEDGHVELGLPIHFVDSIANIYMFRNYPLLFSFFSDLFGMSFFPLPPYKEEE